MTAADYCYLIHNIAPFFLLLYHINLILQYKKTLEISTNPLYTKLRGDNMTEYLSNDFLQLNSCARQELFDKDRCGFAQKVAFEFMQVYKNKKVSKKVSQNGVFFYLYI